MIPISVCNHKGGTGKTTTTMMIAAALGLSGRRVLVIDLDPQGFLSRMMGLTEPHPQKSSSAIFAENAPPASRLIHAFPACDVIPSSARLSADLRRLTRPIDVFWMREYLEAHCLEWDVVLLDTAAALTVYALNALVAAQRVIIPVLPEYQPTVGAEQTFQTGVTVRRKLNPGMETPDFLLTMVDGRKRNHAAYAAYLRDRYEDAVLETIVRTNTSLSTTRHDGRTVFDFDPYGRGARDYAAVADELIHRYGLPND
jgi:chromosome partitioning protein